jgi:ATP-dependent RNA circularization protein (DNA/RNA ligase family)
VAQQHPWIETWCRANEGRILYGEVIGDQKGYTYGLDKNKGELDFYAFDIWEPSGKWTKPFAFDQIDIPLGATVPILYQGPADMGKIKALTDGLSVIDNKTQREGVIISEQTPAPEGVRRPRQFKRVSNVFLEGDSK